jgi:hypothetical protein
MRRTAEQAIRDEIAAAGTGAGKAAVRLELAETAVHKANQRREGAKVDLANARARLARAEAALVAINGDEAGDEPEED